MRLQVSYIGTRVAIVEEIEEMEDIAHGYGNILEKNAFPRAIESSFHPDSMTHWKCYTTGNVMFFARIYTRNAR